MANQDLPLDLREQLRRLGVQRGTAAVKPPHLRRHGPAIEELVAGELADTEHGPCFVSETVYPLHHSHGLLPLGALRTHDPQTVALLARDAITSGVDPCRAAFIDTETTGLSGGTGTYTFLVGVGYYADDEFHVRQFFMRDVTEEQALLHLMSETLRGFQAVVSFNGRAFDLPLLTTRFILSRMDPPLTGLPHLDLLFPARRLWRPRLASCALSSLEENVLGVIRESTDVPGWLIPGLYFEYLRTGDARSMPRVLYHNVQDILSLVTLTTRLCAVLANPLDEESGLSGWDLHSLGRWYEGLNMICRAEETYRAALTRPLPADVRDTVRHDLSLLLKRQGRLEEAAAIWHELIQDEHSCTPWACVELAKYCEWTLRDYPTAAQMTRLAMDFLQSSASGVFVEGELPELQHRLRRLERKMACQPTTSNQY